MTIDFDNTDSRLLDEDDRIVAYLKGQLTEEEEQEFLKQLKENPELKEKAIVTARLVKGLKEVGAEQDKETIGAFLASSEQDIEAITKKSANVITLRKATGWLSIAASVILIVWLGVGYNSYRNTTGLGDEYGKAFSASMISRGGDSSTDVEKKLGTLFNDVQENNNINDAIHELSLCWELSTMETYNDYTDYSAEIGWILAIAHLKDNNKKEAKRTLEKLIVSTEDNSVINKKAKELIEKL